LFLTTAKSRAYYVHEAVCRPLPAQAKVPLLIAGEGKNVLPWIVARHTDMWKAVGPPEKFAGLGETIARHCDAEGRDPAEIERTVMSPLCYTTDEDRRNMMAGLLPATFAMDPQVAARRPTMVGPRDERLETVDAYVRAGVHTICSC
jgi:alkanesulfonate monooxygenase SsuD/methylene tetrahydromethanopterin reductase-like flavin-dependent oxidoreductase (luciferase family)